MLQKWTSSTTFTTISIWYGFNNNFPKQPSLRLERYVLDLGGKFQFWKRWEGSGPRLLRQEQIP